MELSISVRRLLSVVIALHLGAVFVAPFTFNSIPAPGRSAPSLVAERLMWLYGPYVDALYLRHGYAFFAPDPGPSHLFRARLEYSDGRPPLELEFPNRRTQRPRLLYHRHFMLSERLGGNFVPKIAPRDIVDDPVQLVEWRRSREAYERYYDTLVNSYAEHLRYRYGADRAVITRLEHVLLPPTAVLEERQSLTDPRLYDPNPDDVPTEPLP